MALELNLTKNTNDAIQGVKGKYFARVEYKGTIGTSQLAKHMAEHTTSFSKGEILGMLTDMVSCIKELALLGYVIKIDDLGLFKCSVESNGLTLKKDAKVSAGVGIQRKDEDLAENIALQQFAIGNVKLIMQATGETTMDEMTRAASTTCTSKTKALAKSLTGNEADDGGSGSSGSGSSQTPPSTNNGDEPGEGD